MTISIGQLVDEFGAAALAGNGAVFVGAGMSKGAGFPDWWQLLEQPRTRAEVPKELEDAPLVAEYIASSSKVGAVALQTHILEQLTVADKPHAAGHRLLAALPVTEFFTTNYDELIENALPEAQLVVKDNDIRNISISKPAVVKLHGSLTSDPDRRWVAPPVLTRGEYERYESEHPRMWAFLRASYMSKMILFLGFSFSDPNVEILLRLARRYWTHVGDRHLTVMRRPKACAPGDVGWSQYRLHGLKVQDLEKSGIRVCEIDEFDELPRILQALVRRTRPPRLFLSGSKPTDDIDAAAAFDQWCERVLPVLADTDWELSSLGGPAGWQITRAVAKARMAADTYEPDKLVIHFRSKMGPAPELDERLGTARYSNLDREPLLNEVLKDCRVLFAVRGSDRTLQELQIADEAGLSVVPLAASGGAARDFWSARKNDPPLIGGQVPSDETWSQLNDPEPVVAVRAAMSLMRQGMYETP